MLGPNLIAQIDTLKIPDKLMLINMVVQSLQKEINSKSEFSYAVREMESEYKTNKELTAFKDLDEDGFHEYEN